MMKRRQGMKAKVRKIVGNCFNQINIWEDVLFAPAFASRLTNPTLFRIISGWFNTREEILRILNATLSGPSTTPGTDLNLNRHVWVQRAYDKLTLHTPGKLPVRYKLYRMRLKCRDNGATQGVYVEGTLPFAVGSAQAAANLPSGSYWDFWNQTSRQGGDQSGFMPLYADGILAKNVSGVAVTAPTPGSDFEAGNNSAGTIANFHEHTSLPFIFPELKRKCVVECVSKGVLLPGRRKVITVPNRMPPEFRPRDYISDNCPNFSRYSYFYFLRAYCHGPDFRYGQATDNVFLPSVRYSHPVEVVCHMEKTFNFRAGGDSIPTFSFSQSKGDPAMDGWLGPNYGLLDSGSAVAYADATAGFYSTAAKTGDVAVASSGCIGAITSRVVRSF